MSLYFHTVRWQNLLSTGNQFTELFLDRNKSTLIVGENGAGKTTFLDALTFGLYGIPFREINKPQLVNTITNKHLLVEIEFTTNGARYMVRRGMKPAKFEIYKNGSPIALDQDAKARDQQQIFEEEVLKMNYTAFKQIVVLGKTDYVPFMKLKSKQRQEVIENLLDIKVFSLMAALLKAKQDRLNEQMAATVQQIDIAKASLQVHENYIASLHEDRAALIKQLQKKLKNTLEEIDTLKVIKNELSTDVETHRKSVEDRPTVEEKLKRLVQFERKMEDKIADIKRDIAFYQDHDNCPTCTQEIDHDFKDQTLIDCEKKLLEYEAALAQIDVSYKEQSSRQAEIMKVLDEVVDITHQISAVHTSIDHHRDTADELAKEIEELKSQNVHKTQTEIDQLGEAIKMYDAEKQTQLETKEVYDAAGFLLKDTGIKTTIIKQYIPIINKLINKYLAAMSFLINFEIDENFTETIKSAYRDEFTYNSFSEGEKLRIDLAILFTWRAIAKMRNSMSTNLLVLDEIFDSSLDYVGVDDFLRILQDTSGESNIFIISHKTDQLIDKFDQVLKFEQVKNFSRIATYERTPS